MIKQIQVSGYRATGWASAPERAWPRNHVHARPTRQGGVHLAVGNEAARIDVEARRTFGMAAQCRGEYGHLSVSNIEIRIRPVADH